MTISAYACCEGAMLNARMNKLDPGDACAMMHGGKREHAAMAMRMPGDQKRGKLLPIRACDVHDA